MIHTNIIEKPQVSIDVGKKKHPIMSKMLPAHKNKTEVIIPHKNVKKMKRRVVNG